MHLILMQLCNGSASCSKQQSGVVQGCPAMTIKMPRGCLQGQLPSKSD